MRILHEGIMRRWYARVEPFVIIIGSMAAIKVAIALIKSLGERTMFTSTQEMEAPREAPRFGEIVTVYDMDGVPSDEDFKDRKYFCVDYHSVNFDDFLRWVRRCETQAAVLGVPLKIKLFADYKSLEPGEPSAIATSLSGYAATVSDCPGGSSSFELIVRAFERELQKANYVVDRYRSARKARRAEERPEAAEATVSFIV